MYDKSWKFLARLVAPKEPHVLEAGGASAGAAVVDGAFVGAFVSAVVGPP
jgi:hypothetical protein